MAMKKIAILALLFCVTACQTPDNGENPSEELVEKSMEQLIEDLQKGLFSAGYYEEYDGDVCVIRSDEYFGDYIGAKFGDVGLDHSIAFYADGTCRYGYSNYFVGGCSNKDSSHPKSLYDTWQWSYDIAAKTITFTAPDLIKAGKVNSTLTIKVLSYKGDKMYFEGKLPCTYSSNNRFIFRSTILPYKDRHSFEANYKDEDDYPCCRQY